MKVNSLAFRLFMTAAGWALLVLPIAALVVSALYRADAQASFDKRLGFILTVIVANSLEEGGQVPGRPEPTGEPFFEISHSGWYWQIQPLDGRAGKRMISNSLASEQLALPSAVEAVPDRNNRLWATLNAPVGEKQLRVTEAIHQFKGPQGTRAYSFAVAGPMWEVNERVAQFRNRLLIALALAGAGLLAVTLFQVRFGLLPLRNIENGLAAIRSGEAEKLEGELPSEIKPLQVEMNALITANQEIIDRARTQVGNLAHALKTPLAVITNEANDNPADTFAQRVAGQARVMGDQISLYLDRARMAARVGVIGRVTPVEPVVDGLMRALGRINEARGVTYTSEVEAGAKFQGEKQDIEEMLGNLMENGGKWAKSQVSVSLSVRSDPQDRTKRRLAICVEDDGPGLTAEQCEQAIARGKRLDETVPGTGLGLSIVNDLVQSYRGSLTLDRSKLGGLRVQLDLPAV
ncbi:MAG: ATP-binding protein [Pseudomonadota bacterium]